MNQEDLKKYKEKLSQLSEDEKGKRDIYLSQISSGERPGPQVGFATIDQPWLSTFDMDHYHTIKNDKTIYQDIVQQNSAYPKDIAIEYFGCKVKYEKLFKMIDDTAKALVDNGVKAGDYVTVCSAGNPELIYVVYALSKIGAIANLMAPYFELDQMRDRINDCNSKMLIVMDDFLPRIKSAIESSSIEKTVVVPTLNSSPLRYIKKSKIKLADNEIYWNDFIKKSKKSPIPPTFGYKKDYPLCMVYSSGTTGASKAIVLSNDSFQNSVLAYDAFKFDRIRQQKMYQIIPPWYSTGLNTSIHLALHSGVIVFQDPRFERDVFVKNIIKHKIDYAVAPTSMYEGFLDTKNVKGKRLTNLGNPFEGGEPLPFEVKKQIEGVWKEMGCDSKLTSGYGQCECGATVTSPSQHFEHHNGSVALPLPGITLGIFDDDNNELGYNQRGNIYVDTSCGMLEYYKKPEATKKYFYEDGFGHKWSRTGDVGYIASNGDLFVEGRASDYSVINGEKIYNFDIENEVMPLDYVENCDCLPKKNEDGLQSLALHIILKNKNTSQLELEKLLTDIQTIIFEKYGNPNMIPEYFKMHDVFPHKPSGKRDTEQLKNDQNGYIYINKQWIIDNMPKKKM